MTKKKVLLLFPNSTNAGVMPLAIAILSAIAKRVGFEVEYFETSFYKKSKSAVEDREITGEFKGVSRESFIKFLPYEHLRTDFYEKLRNYKPDILAVSANSPEYELFCELIEGIQSLRSKPFVIVGGVHPTVLPDDVITNPYVDALCMGEGEKAWEDFLIAFKAGQDITKIQNLWVKGKSGIHKNPIGPLLSEEELWASPLDLSFFDDRHIFSPFDGVVYRRGQIELSRGCPYNCTYCVNTAFKDIYKGLGKFYRVRPLESVKEAVERNLQLGSDMLQFQDECFFAVPYPRLEKFCKWYGKEVRLPMMVQSRPETITDEKMKLMADMGIPVQVSLGVESGNQRVLRDICNRNMTTDQIKNAFKTIKKYNFRSTAFTMIGFPTETREEVFETIYLIRESDVDISIMSIFFPFIGIPLRQYCIERGYISGSEKTRTFTDKSILKNQPMSADEIGNLRRTYSLYARLPEEYFPQIELCERNYEQHVDLYKELVSLMQRDYYNIWEELRSYRKSSVKMGQLNKA